MSDLQQGLLLLILRLLDVFGSSLDGQLQCSLRGDVLTWHDHHPPPLEVMPGTVWQHPPEDGSRITIFLFLFRRLTNSYVYFINKRIKTIRTCALSSKQASLNTSPCCFFTTYTSNTIFNKDIHYSILLSFHYCCFLQLEGHLLATLQQIFCIVFVETWNFL